MWDENGELQGGTQSRMVDRQAPGEDNETTSGNERLYTRAEVQRMSEEEQLANVDAIRESMGLWDAEGKLSKESEITIEEVRDDFEQIKHIKNLENELHVQLFKRSKYGMILNENGKKLYSQIKDAIDVILKAEAIFNMHSNINLGVHVNMPSKIYNSAILKFYENHQNSIINIHQLTAENMFSMLEKQKIDIVFSKKYSDEIYNSKEIKFIKIGELHDVFIVNANSQYLNKKLSKKDLRNTTIYTLKKFSSAYQNLIKELEYSENDTINVDNVNYTAMLELLKVRDIITVITKEYVEEKIADNELCVLDVGFSLPNAEFGLYYNVNNKFKELNDLIEILKNN